MRFTADILWLIQMLSIFFLFLSSLYSTFVHAILSIIFSGNALLQNGIKTLGHFRYWGFQFGVAAAVVVVLAFAVSFRVWRV